MHSDWITNLQIFPYLSKGCTDFYSLTKAQILLLHCQIWRLSAMMIIPHSFSHLNSSYLLI
jgi:hypothetical protein